MTGKANKVRLTDAVVRRLRPGSTEYIVRDIRIAGLGVRVRPSGHRSFVWHGTVNGRMVRTTVGSAALMTMEKARAACRALLDGSHPRCSGDLAGRAGVPLFRDFVVEDWLPARRPAVEGGSGSPGGRSPGAVSETAISGSVMPIRRGSNSQWPMSIPESITATWATAPGVVPAPSRRAIRA